MDKITLKKRVRNRINWGTKIYNVQAVTGLMERIGKQDEINIKELEKLKKNTESLIIKMKREGKENLNVINELEKIKIAEKTSLKDCEKRIEEMNSLHSQSVQGK